MRIALDGAGIGRGLGAEIPPLTAIVDEGAPRVLAVETDERPMLVALLAAGRLAPTTGSVLLDGRADDAALRSRVAVVDTPVVSEAPAGVALATILAEELGFAGLPSSRRAITRFLTARGLADYAKLPLRALPAARRIRLFSELAALRPGVGAIVLTSPERHGAAPAEWYPALDDLSATGLLVLVVTDPPTRDLLVGFGARDATLTDTPDTPETPESPLS